MRLSSSPFASTTHDIAPKPVRFRTVVQLKDGAFLGAEAETRFAFEDRVSFGPAGARQPVADPARWLATQISTVAQAAAHGAMLQRPILFSAPVAALAHSNTPVACSAAIRQTLLAPQEVCLVFPDTAFAGDPADSSSRVARLRRLGFRAGIDMRKSWQTALNDSLRLLIDIIRIDARQVENDRDLATISMTADAAGIHVIADNARWRDADDLCRAGVTAAISPRTDA